MKPPGLAVKQVILKKKKMVLYETRARCTFPFLQERGALQIFDPKSLLIIYLFFFVCVIDYSGKFTSAALISNCNQFWDYNISSSSSKFASNF